jgi:hypothetical protein
MTGLRPERSAAGPKMRAPNIDPSNPAPKTAPKAALSTPELASDDGRDECDRLRVEPVENGHHCAQGNSAPLNRLRRNQSMKSLTSISGRDAPRVGRTAALPCVAQQPLNVVSGDRSWIGRGLGSDLLCNWIEIGIGQTEFA